MSDTSLLDTQVETELRSVIRNLLADRCAAVSVAAMYDGDRALVKPLWKAVSQDLGLAGLLIPEVRGGAGAGAREAAVVIEELGRAVAPVPFLTSSVIATSVLLATSPGSQSDGLLSALAAGEQTAALVMPFSAVSARQGFGVTLGSDGKLTGRVTSVAGALEAGVLLVPVSSAAGLAVFLVESRNAVLEPVVSLDMSRQLADICFDAAECAPALLADIGGPAVDRALVIGAVLLASEQLGLARWCLETTVAYLQERRQFGRLIGSFQSLKHRIADLYLAIETAAAAARYAAVTVAAGGDEAAIAAAVAKAWCSDVAVRAAEETIQLHGGVGMTWEHPAHLYLKRAKTDQSALGSPGHHLERLAHLVNLPSPART